MAKSPTELRERLRSKMIENAAELNRLDRRRHEAFKRRHESDDRQREFFEVGSEFSARYPELWLPGGPYPDFFDRLRAGDPEMIELGLCFLEVRPYFFHSGYYWKKILQVCKRVPMSAEHAERLRLLILNYAQWKELRKESAARGAAVSRQIWPLVCRFFDMFPAHIADHHYDGAATVGDLYRVVCNALKIEPLANPAPEMGEVRAAYRRGGNVHAWHSKVWSPEDVWATLEWLIRDVYGLEPTFQISPDVLLRSLKDK